MTLPIVLSSMTEAPLTQTSGRDTAPEEDVPLARMRGFAPPRPLAQSSAGYQERLPPNWKSGLKLCW